MIFFRASLSNLKNTLVDQKSQFHAVKNTQRGQTNTLTHTWPLPLIDWIGYRRRKKVNTLSRNINIKDKKKYRKYDTQIKKIQNTNNIKLRQYKRQREEKMQAVQQINIFLL